MCVCVCVCVCVCMCVCVCERFCSYLPRYHISNLIPFITDSGCNLLSFLLRCSTRPYEWGTQ